MNDKSRERLDELIDHFDTAMLVMRSLQGELRARPMAIAGHGEEGLLYFATRAEDEKLEEILQSPEVAVTMQASDRYLSISGRGRLETDVLLAKKLWSPAMNIWFPEGAEKAEFTLIRVEPTYGEYWDRAGLRKVEFLWEAGKALLGRQKVEPQDFGGHEKIQPEPGPDKGNEREAGNEEPS